MIPIKRVEAWEVLDSRGYPTVRTRVETANAAGTFTVPAGASTGTHEALERRDDDDRYGGMGVRGAVKTIRKELAPEVVGRDATDQRNVDAVLEACDGTADLSRLGANAILGVSGAVAHAGAAATDRPLFEHLSGEEPGCLPMPMMNVISGGLHAAGGIEIQDFLIIPAGSDSYSEALETVWAVRQATRDRILAKGDRPLIADEGGFAPPLSSVDEAFDLLEAAIHDAGHESARDDVAFALDVAATHFHDESRDAYVLKHLGLTLDADELIDHVCDWVAERPLVSVEDPLAEDDWSAWQQLTDRIGDDVQVLGDDLLATNMHRLERAVGTSAANAVLVKPNQTGTLTRAIDVVTTAQSAGFEPVISARSGETSDVTIADLAVALNAGQIKIGSLARSERLAKYNRLLEIERTRSAFAGAT